MTAAGADRPPRAQGAVAAVLAALVFAALQLATPHAVGVDGLFHAKCAELIRDNLPRPWMPPFRWLELTSLRADRFADFHWGFHLLLVPFTAAGTETAAKIAPVVFASAGFLALWFVMRRRGVRLPLLWCLLALGASPIFLMRLSQNKAPVALLALLVLIAWAALEGRDALAGALCLAATWVYPVVPIVGAVAGVSLLAHALTARRLPWRGALWLAGGMAAGLVLHPDLPRNLAFVWTNFAESVTIRTGEYAPLRARDALENVALLAGVFLLGAVRLARGTVADRPAAIAFGLQAAVMGVLTARYVRGIDYLPPFVALFAAATLDAPLAAALARGGAGSRASFFAEGIAPVWGTRARRAGARALFVLALGGALLWQIHRGREIVRRNSATVARRLEPAARWLAERTAEGEIVLNLSSGDFEELWLYDTRNTYFIGLNLNFLAAESPALHELYGAFYAGGDVGALQGLLDRTGARYLVASDRLPPPLRRLVTTSPRFETVYSDRSCAILRTLEEAGR